MSLLALQKRLRPTAALRQALESRIRSSNDSKNVSRGHRDTLRDLAIKPAATQIECDDAFFGRREGRADSRRLQDNLQDAGFSDSAKQISANIVVMFGAPAPMRIVMSIQCFAAPTRKESPYPLEPQGGSAEKEEDQALPVFYSGAVFCLESRRGFRRDVSSRKSPLDPLCEKRCIAWTHAVVLDVSYLVVAQAGRVVGGDGHARDEFATSSKHPVALARIRVHMDRCVTKHPVFRDASVPLLLRLPVRKKSGSGSTEVAPQLLRPRSGVIESDRLH